MAGGRSKKQNSKNTSFSNSCVFLSKFHSLNKRKILYPKSGSERFSDYHQQANDSKRIIPILLLFATILCPLFAWLFKYFGAPEIFYQTILSGTYVFPFMILLDRFVPPLKGKLPQMFFVYFSIFSILIIEDLRSKAFRTHYYAFFIGFFSVMMFSLQRFWYSVFYFILVFVYFTVSIFITPSRSDYIDSRYLLFVTIGVFYMAMYYSRNRIIQSLQDYNQYLKRIVNNPGNGFVLFTLENDQIAVSDYNLEAFPLLHVSEKEELEQKMQRMWSLRERRRIVSLQKKEFYQVRIQEVLHDQILDVRVIPLWFKTGKYYLAYIIDVTQQVNEQNELSREMLRAELAEENNKILEVEIQERIYAQRSLQIEMARTKAIFESSYQTLVLTLDLQFRIVLFNSHLQHYFEYQTGLTFASDRDVLAYLRDVFNPLHYRYLRLLLHSARTGKSHQVEVNFLNRDGKERWLELFLNPICNDQGDVIEISLLLHDITDKKRNETELIESLKEKEVLLKEVHHRVKNNLQVISSILNLQSNFVHDERILALLEESRNRIHSMAIIHENLYKTSNFSSINFTKYLQELTKNLVESYHIGKEKSISIHFDLQEVDLSLDQAIPCGLILNEIITNSLKYAFVQQTSGTILLEVKVVDQQVHITIADDGIGLPEDYNYMESDSLGIQLIVTLIEQLDGRIKIENSNGLKYFIIFDRQN